MKHGITTRCALIRLYLKQSTGYHYLRWWQTRHKLPLFTVWVDKQFKTAIPQFSVKPNGKGTRLHQNIMTKLLGKQ
jgi:hypothetical protein